MQNELEGHKNNSLGISEKKVLITSMSARSNQCCVSYSISCRVCTYVRLRVACRVACPVHMLP